MVDCWVITDGNAGARSQAIGLAESLGIKFEEKTFRLKAPFRLFAPYIKFNYLKYKSENNSKFSGPLPKLAIICGNSARSIGSYLKKQSPKIFTIFIQDPKISPKYFDLVIAPNHDKITGPNVIKTFFALNRVTKEKLQNEEENHSKIFKNLTKPFNTILIGGTTKKYSMSIKACNKFIEDLKYILTHHKGSFLITNSRRTPKYLNNKIHEIIQGKDNIVFYDYHSANNNPFFAFLAKANQIFITNDSISMLSEAKATDSDVAVIPLLGHNKTKVAKVFDNLLQKEQISLFKNSKYKKQKKDKMRETDSVAEKVRSILISKGVLKKTYLK
ncbi:MAG: mitochondrial fission ELM1 family protein [Rickettsiales bacterium]